MSISDAVPNPSPKDAAVLIYLANDEAPADQDFLLVQNRTPDEQNPEGLWDRQGAVNYAAWSVRHPEKQPWIRLTDGTILGLEAIRAEWHRLQP